jgi:hypothetical protein
MTTKANILLQNYVEAVWEYRLERDSGNEPVAEEAKMDAAELELTTYINELEKKADRLAQLEEDNAERGDLSSD